MIKVYKKRPVEIQAIQLTWENWGHICDFIPKEQFGGGCYLNENNEILPDNSGYGKMGLLINTLEGKMIAAENDYIIRGIKGEFYPCKPEIFEATYDEVNNV
jgi:hypothetical protein